MSREKQIEGLAEAVRIGKHAMCDVCSPNGRDCEECETDRLVNAIYNAGYRKQEEGEWIRAENPPEEYRDECGELIPFLVCCQGTVYPFRAMYDGANWGDGIGVLKVTHWMPLPEPPDTKEV